MNAQKINQEAIDRYIAGSVALRLDSGSFKLEGIELPEWGKGRWIKKFLADNYPNESTDPEIAGCITHFCESAIALCNRGFKTEQLSSFAKITESKISAAEEYAKRVLEEFQTVAVLSEYIGLGSNLILVAIEIKKRFMESIINLRDQISGCEITSKDRHPDLDVSINIAANALRKSILDTVYDLKSILDRQI